jgi:hypothetical protein
MPHRKIICYDTDRKLTTNIVRRFAQSINESNREFTAECRSLQDFRQHGIPCGTWMVCSLGILRGTGLIMKSAASHGINRLYMDHSYFNSGYSGKGWLRMTVNGHTMNRIDPADNNRWKSYFKNNNNVMEWKTAAQRGQNILILPPTNAISWYFDAGKWLEDTLASIKKYLPPEEHDLIKVRQKPMDPMVDKLGNLIGKASHPEDCSLQEDLDNARVVVAYNSMVTVEATRQGIPVITSHHNACAPISFGFNHITEPNKLDVEPSRRDLFYWLSCCQFSEKERTNGVAWDHIVRKQLNGI